MSIPERLISSFAAACSDNKKILQVAELVANLGAIVLPSLGQKTQVIVQANNQKMKAMYIRVIQAKSRSRGSGGLVWMLSFIRTDHEQHRGPKPNASTKDAQCCSTQFRRTTRQQERPRAYGTEPTKRKHRVKHAICSTPPSKKEHGSRSSRTWALGNNKMQAPSKCNVAAHHFEKQCGISSGARAHETTTHGNENNEHPERYYFTRDDWGVNGAEKFDGGGGVLLETRIELVEYEAAGELQAPGSQGLVISSETLRTPPIAASFFEHIVHDLLNGKPGGLVRSGTNVVMRIFSYDSLPEVAISIGSEAPKELAYTDQHCATSSLDVRAYVCGAQLGAIPMTAFTVDMIKQGVISHCPILRRFPETQEPCMSGIFHAGPYSFLRRLILSVRSMVSEA
ncbi:hypothetical protein ARMGADRAFT_1022694 [Armillaria gallica]|uniref:Uncharacterized protein n=1 Tax=Armillaria gallica TaxID=47427 RepID=A0A2H3EM24_ARMGA|nr:hypothetical protein ARMGADRAFT_1022694 [Armillaria gallica]